jgi:hypothetical protein
MARLRTGWQRGGLRNRPTFLHSAPCSNREPSSLRELSSRGLGGFLEELALRGILLQAVKSFASHWNFPVFATAAGIVVAAAAAWVIHLYQGLRAACIIAQLSVLFGVLFAISGYNLWPVILCHGFYDTIAFIRFANKQSKYSDLASQ